MVKVFEFLKASLPLDNQRFSIIFDIKLFTTKAKFLLYKVGFHDNFSPKTSSLDEGLVKPRYHSSFNELYYFYYVCNFFLSE